MGKQAEFKLINLSNPSAPILIINKAENFQTRFLGLMGRKSIDHFYGLLFTQPKPSRIDSAIHMFFMHFDIAVIWLDQNNVVIDSTMAKKWHPFYIPRKPASLILETHPDRLADYRIGDTIQVQ